MSSLVGVTQKSASLQGFQILTYTDMQTALAYIGGISGSTYGGQINMQNNNGTLTWTLLINNSASTSQSPTAVIGDWVILTGGTIVSVCKQANFATLYTSP
jgi:hypothetical protein